VLHYLHGHELRAFQAAAPTYSEAFRTIADELDAKGMNSKVLNITVEYIPDLLIGADDNSHLVTVYFDYSL
jgi:hypothetical protein